ncbi:MAG TPA: 50S ribosomal protein L18 [Clostridiales bacterium]|nr:50S ribosomal protein L18 [Clostridiales bacterium]
MYKQYNRKAVRNKKHASVRLKISGTPDCPRLAVFRSAKHIYAQVIDDVAGNTLAAASTLDASLKENYGGNKEAAAAVGKIIAEKALEKGIKQVVFDRGGMIYHGRVKALADSAREAGLEF